MKLNYHKNGKLLIGENYLFQIISLQNLDPIISVILTVLYSDTKYIPNQQPIKVKTIKLFENAKTNFNAFNSNIFVVVV